MVLEIVFMLSIVYHLCLFLEWDIIYATKTYHFHLFFTCFSTCFFTVPIDPVDIASDNVPGGRHDNDYEDYRTVDILPSVEEIECKKEPYLPDLLPCLHKSAQGDCAFFVFLIL